MHKYTKNLLSIAAILSLAACNQPNSNIKESSQENTKTSASKKEEQTISPEAQKLVLDYIAESIKNGTLKKEDVKNEDVLALTRVFTQALKNSSNGALTDAQKSYLFSTHHSSNPASISSALNSLKNGTSQLFTILNAKTDSPQAEKVKNIISNNIPKLSVKEIKTIKNAPFFAIFIDINGTNFPLYTNENADYYFVMDNPELGRFSLLSKDGTAIDLNNELATRSIYKDVLSKIDTSKLITNKYGKGERSIYIFTDPDCPFCQKLDIDLYNNLNETDNVKIHYVMSPLLDIHPEAHIKGAKILCSDNPTENWNKWQMTRSLVEPSGKFDEKSCVQKVADQSIYSEIMGFNATPTIIREDGKYIQGQPSIEQFRDFLNQ